MKKSAVYVALLLVIVIVVAVLCIRIFTKAPAPEIPEPVKTEATLPPVQDDGPTVAPLPAPEKPAEPKAPRETEAPFETRPPMEETEEPEETPVPVEASGSFRSDTGTYLNLLVDWSAVSSGENTVALTVKYSVQSYSIFTAASPGNLVLSVNGKTYTASCPAINYDGADLAVTPLATFNAEVPRGTVTLNAVWHFKGSYSGTELDDITAEAALDLN